MHVQVLTVNQVVDILLHYMDRGDWSEALLRTIPPRKRHRTEQQIGGPVKQMRYEPDQTTSSQNMDAMSEVGDDLMTSYNIESQSASLS